MLQEKIEMEECEIQHKRQSSKVNNHETKLSAFTTAHAPTMIEEKHEGDDNVVNDNWIKPKRRCQQRILIRKTNVRKRMMVGTSKVII